MPNTHQNITALLGDIADAIREKDETTDPIVADNFPSRIRAIPSGGGTDGPLEMIGQMDTRVYLSNGNMDTSSSSPGPFSTYVYEMPFTSGDAERLCILVQKPEATNRCRVGFYTSNPLDATVSSSGRVIAGFPINNIIQDGSSLLSGANGAAPSSGNGGYKYVGIFVSSESGSAPYPKVWVAHG